MKVRMLNNRVLVEPIRNPELSNGGVYTGVPTTTFVADRDKAEQVCMGKVIAVGPGKRQTKKGTRRPTGLEPGQFITFSDTCHRPAGVKDYIVLRDDDVMFVTDELPKRLEFIYH